MPHPGPVSLLLFGLTMFAAGIAVGFLLPLAARSGFAPLSYLILPMVGIAVGLWAFMLGHWLVGQPRR